jgi:hypothetical protein
VVPFDGGLMNKWKKSATMSTSIGNAVAEETNRVILNRLKRNASEASRYDLDDCAREKELSDSASANIKNMTQLAATMQKY